MAKQRLKQRYDQAVRAGDWKTALVKSKQLIDHYPSSIEGYLRAARASTYLGKYKIAAEYKWGVLELALERSRGEIISTVEELISEEFSPCAHTTIQHTNGVHNLGVLFHDTENGRVVTKIVQKSPSYENEQTFYRDVLSNLTEFTMAPRFITSFYWSDFLFIITEWINGEPAQLEHHKLVGTKLLSFSRGSYRRLQQYHGSQRNPTLSDHPTSVQRFFHNIHTKAVNEDLFKHFESYLRRHAMNADLLILNRVLSRVFSIAQPFKHLDFNKHFGLVHSDCRAANVLITPNKQVKLIDWAGFGIGLSIVDLVRYYTSQNLSWAELWNLADFRTEIWESLDEVEKIYFKLCYFVMYIMQRRPRSHPARITTDVVDLADQLVHALGTQDSDAMRFMSKSLPPIAQLSSKVAFPSHYSSRTAILPSFLDSFNAHVKDEVHSSQSFSTELKQSQDTEESRTQRINELENQLARIRASRSWRITSPLRKVTARFQEFKHSVTRKLK